MNRINWAKVGVFVAIVLVVFIVGLWVLPLLLGGYGGWGTMGPGMMGGQWSQGWCPFCGGTGRYPGGVFGGVFGWLLMAMTMLLPLGLLALFILGVVWLARAVARPGPGVTPPPQACPGCGNPVAVGWRHCPHCGEDLQSPS